MKYKYLLFALSFFKLCDTQAQKTEIRWGAENKNKKSMGYYSLTSDGKGNLLKLSYDVIGGGIQFMESEKERSMPILTKIDNNFNEILSNKFYEDKDGYVNAEFLKLKKGIYLRSSKYDKETKTTEHIAQALNLTTLAPQGKIISFGHFAALGGGFFGDKTESDLYFEYSIDSSNLMVFAEPPVKKKEKAKYYMAVYNENMIKQWERTVELPYLDNFIEINDFFITKAGQVCILIKQYEGEIKKEAIKEDGEKVPGYVTKLLVYNNAKDNPKEFIININNNFVNNISLIADEKDNLNLFGTYKEKHSGYVTGFFKSTIEIASGKVTLNKIENFTPELIEQIAKDDQGSKKEKDPGISKFFRLKAIIGRDNGSIDHLFEYTRTKRITRTSSATSMTRTYYIHTKGDILNINIDKQGKSTTTRIPKLQEYSTILSYDHPIMGTSFKALPFNNKLFIFYNDNSDNLENDLDKKPESTGSFYKANFVQATIEENGVLKREILYNNKKTLDATTIIANSQFIGKNKISLYALKVGIFIKPKEIMGSLELQ